MIRIEDVSFSYEGGSGPALDHIDLHVEKGQLVVLAGGSGCGKTTLIRLLNGLIPDCFEGTMTGKVSVMGKDPQLLKTIGMSAFVGSVFQNPKSQFFNVNSLNELAFPLENRAVPREEILDKIEKTANQLHMQSLVGRNMFHLSSGEKQKIAFASVAMSDQPVLVLDEPSSNLDMEAVHDLKEILKQWKNEGKTMIISEHRFFFLKELVDRFIIMEQGRIMEDLNHSQVLQMTLEQFHQRGLRSFDPLMEQIYCHPSCTGSCLTIRELAFTYPDSSHGIHVENRKFSLGHVIALTGLNGAGKSTFIRCLSGLQKKARGTVELQDTSCSLKQMVDQCTMVMQDVNHQLFTDSVHNELAFELRHRGMEKTAQEQKIRDTLEDMDLSELSDRHPQSLSGGQKQRLTIAAASLSNKPVILFDEPTSGLDYAHMKQCSSLIRKLTDRGKLVFVVSHDFQFLMECCDDVVLIEDGKITEQYPLDFNNQKKLAEWFRQQS